MYYYLRNMNNQKQNEKDLTPIGQEESSERIRITDQNDGFCQILGIFRPKPTIISKKQIPIKA